MNENKNTMDLSKEIKNKISKKAQTEVEIAANVEDKRKVFATKIFETNEFQNFDSKVAFGIGKDIADNIVVYDIAKAPHMLIAASDGSDISVCINTLIMSILYKATPEEVRFIMIDTKATELSVYNRIPHMLIPVVTDPQKAQKVLKWTVDEMMRRYDLLAETRTINFTGYNKKVEKGKAEKVKKLQQIVIIIDELSDIMMANKKQVEESICRLAQLARAVGIYLIIATQRPSADVITRLIKNYIPSRISFKVSSGTDSCYIIGTNGAEKLLGQGDMLFKAVDMDKPIRIQGAFVTEQEFAKIVDYIKTDVPNYDASVLEDIARAEAAKNEGSVGIETNSSDELIDQVIDFIVHTKETSSSAIQRKFRIGFNRANRIIDELEERGIVGPENGSKSRKVLINSLEISNGFLKERESISKDTDSKQKSEILKSILEDYRTMELNKVIPVVLPCIIGRDTENNLIVKDFEKLTDLLIAGDLYTENINYLNSLILSIIFRSTPKDVRFIMIDVNNTGSFDIYNNLPHMLMPVIKDRDTTEAVLVWLEYEKNLREGNHMRVKEINPNYDKPFIHGEIPRIIVIVNEYSENKFYVPTDRQLGLHMIAASTDYKELMYPISFPTVIALNANKFKEIKRVLKASKILNNENLNSEEILFKEPLSSEAVKLNNISVINTEAGEIIDSLKLELPIYDIVDVVEKIKKFEEDRLVISILKFLGKQSIDIHIAHEQDENKEDYEEDEEFEDYDEYEEDEKPLHNVIYTKNDHLSECQSKSVRDIDMSEVDFDEAFDMSDAEESIILKKFEELGLASPKNKDGERELYINKIIDKLLK